MRSLIEMLESRTDVVRLGDETAGFAVVAPQLGAKIIGISLNGIDGENLLWINDAMADGAFWNVPPTDSPREQGDGKSQPDWNAGGWRTWISPEKHFYFDRQENWTVPASMDPGDFHPVSGPDNAVTYESDCTIQDKDQRRYDLTIRRTIRVNSEPKGGLPHDLSRPVKSFSVEKTHFLVNRGDAVIGEAILQVGLWSLLQVKAAGTCIIPINKQAGLPDYRDYGPKYFDTVPPDRIHVDDRYISWKFDGQKRGKIGIHPKVARPYIAYLRTSVDPPILFIKQFAVEPESMYTDCPWDQEYDYGDAVQSYNDGGAMGGFSEIECHGPVHPLQKGEELWHTINLSVYQGSLEDLKKIGTFIMGIDMDAVHLY